MEAAPLNATTHATLLYDSRLTHSSLRAALRAQDIEFTELENNLKHAAHSAHGHSSYSHSQTPDPPVLLTGVRGDNL